MRARAQSVVTTLMDARVHPPIPDVEQQNASRDDVAMRFSHHMGLNRMRGGAS